MAEESQGLIATAAYWVIYCRKRAENSARTGEYRMANRAEDLIGQYLTDLFAPAPEQAGVNAAPQSRLYRPGPYGYFTQPACCGAS